jgi:hypothetical protein
MDCLSLNLHIWSYVAVGSLYGVTCLIVILSEIPSLNSIVKVPFTCVCITQYGPMVRLPNLRGFQFFLCIRC